MTKAAIATVGLTLVSLLPGRAAGQTPSSLEDVVRAGRLTRGEAVHVTLVDGRRLKAEITEVSFAHLELYDGQNRRKVSEAEIMKVARRDPISGGVWIGIGMGVLATPVTCKLGPYCAFSGFIGGLVGGVIDAAVQEVLYKRPERNVGYPQVSLFLTDGEIGVWTSVEW